MTMDFKFTHSDGFNPNKTAAGRPDLPEGFFLRAGLVIIVNSRGNPPDSGWLRAVVTASGKLGGEPFICLRFRLVTPALGCHKRRFA